MSPSWRSSRGASCGGLFPSFPHVDSGALSGALPRWAGLRQLCLDLCAPQGVEVSRGLSLAVPCARRVRAQGEPRRPGSWEWEPGKQGPSVPGGGGEHWGRCQAAAFCAGSPLVTTGGCGAGALPGRLGAPAPAWGGRPPRRVVTRAGGGVWKERPSQKGASCRHGARAAFNVHFSFVCLHVACLIL